MQNSSESNSPSSLKPNSSSIDIASSSADSTPPIVLDYAGLKERGITSGYTRKFASLTEFWQVAEADFYKKATEYWKEKVTNDIDGMLGGFTHVHERDVKESSSFLKKVLKDVTPAREGEKPFLYCLECGSGNGRVTKNLLSQYFDYIDCEDVNEEFLIRAKEECAKIKETFAVGLQELHTVFKDTKKPKYHCVWIQWCSCFVTDQDFIKLMELFYDLLYDGGILCFKENIAADCFVVDEDDGSLTRSNDHYCYLFSKVESKFTLIENVKQKHWEKGLFALRMYCLKKK
nr:unnamed protein product [Naegleria fowleri]